MVAIVHRTDAVVIGLDQFDQMRSATLTASIGDGYTLSEAIAWLEDYVGQRMPPQYSAAFTDEARDFLRAGTRLAVAFAIALVLIYLLLAVHFNSLLDPLVVMFSVPLAAVGVLVTLFLTETTLNVQSYIGCIMLGGIVVNNAILLVDQAGRLVKEGMHLDLIGDKGLFGIFHGLVQGCLESTSGLRILTPHVDEGMADVQGIGRDDDALDQLVGIAFDELAILERSGLSFVRIADNVFLLTMSLTAGCPFYSRGKAASTPSPQSRNLNSLNNLFWFHFMQSIEC